MILRLVLTALLCGAALPAVAQVTQTKNAQVFPLAPVATACCTLTTGGTAQNFQNATSNSGTGAQSPVSCLIVNPATATDQNIATAEEIWVNVLGAATQTAGATSIPVAAGQSITLAPATSAISWNAATTGHKITGYCWQ